MSTKMVNCYVHAKKGFLLIPMGYNSAGVGNSINRPQALIGSESDAQLGATVRLTTQWCDFALYDTAVPMPELAAAGVRGWSQFARAWQLVVVTFDATLRVTPTTRDAKANYWHLVDQRAELPLTATDPELGEAIRHALSQCREGPRD